MKVIDKYNRKEYEFEKEMSVEELKSLLKLKPKDAFMVIIDKENKPDNYIIKKDEVVTIRPIISGG